MMSLWNSLKIMAWPIVTPIVWLWGKYMVLLDPDGQAEVSQDYAAAMVPETDLLTDPAGAYRSLPGDGYQAEQELAEKYRSFVSEILRLALVTLGGLTFLNAYMHKSNRVLWIACVGAVFLFLSIGRSLQFLFGASEGLRWYIAGFRHHLGTDVQKAKVVEILAWRGEIIRRCRIQKQQAAGFLLLGAVVMAIAVFVSLFIELPAAAKTQAVGASTPVVGDAPQATG